MHRKLFVMTLLASLNALAADVQQLYPEGTAREEKLSPILKLDDDQLSRLPTREQLEKGPITLGPAEPLTYVEVYAVGSSYQGWEFLDSNLYSTQWDHGGSVLLVAVLEIGYGYQTYAKMNGGLLSYSANYLNESLCWSGYGQLSYCSPGQTVAGYLRYYDVSGHQAGQFWYENTSANSPWNTMFDGIVIR